MYSDIAYKSIITTVEFCSIRHLFIRINKAINIDSSKTSMIEESKVILIRTLEYLLKRRRIKLVFFGISKENINYLNHSANIYEQLDFLRNSFPTEYDKDIPDKDIMNLWWFIYCPVIIGWKTHLGQYLFIE